MCHLWTEIFLLHFWFGYLLSFFFTVFFSFYLFILLVYFACLLHRSELSRYPCLFLVFFCSCENFPVFHLSMSWYHTQWSFHIWPLLCWVCFPSVFSLLSDFYNEIVLICQSFFCISWDDSGFFSIQFIYITLVQSP